MNVSEFIVAEVAVVQFIVDEISELELVVDNAFFHGVGGNFKTVQFI